MNDVWTTIQQRQMMQSDADKITYFGITDTRGQHMPFGIKRNDRSMHTYVIGKSGMGKSTLLENMAVQDILGGEGLCFIDPHGGTAEKILSYVPEHRIKDVLYFAPFDLQYPISFNVLENVSADKRHLVVAGLMSAFAKIWIDAWSARMAYILQNTLGALLEYPEATLLGVNRMYSDKNFRSHVVKHVTDPTVRMFWLDEYAGYGEKYAQEATAAIQNKIGQFASNALIRNVIGQPQSSFDIREMMDQKKIFIVNLSKGRVGEGNANLLGSMIVTKIYLAAMSRADVASQNFTHLPPFYLYVDEFQNFANKSFAEILSEARKYKLGLTIAHQYIEQMEEEVRAAVFGNVGTMISFRVGAYDAEVLEKEFSPVFLLNDIVNLGARQIYLKLMIDSVSSSPFSASTLPPVPSVGSDHSEAAKAYSRSKYAQRREEVESEIEAWSTRVFENEAQKEKERLRDEKRDKRYGEGERKESFPQRREEKRGEERRRVSPEKKDFPKREKRGEENFSQKNTFDKNTTSLSYDKRNFSREEFQKKEARLKKEEDDLRSTLSRIKASSPVFKKEEKEKIPSRTQEDLQEVLSAFKQKSSRFENNTYVKKEESAFQKKEEAKEEKNTPHPDSKKENTSFYKEEEKKKKDALTPEEMRSLLS
jgi:hypothetical protein